ncbi:hypothetical protein CALVIDRAFT_245127 [Calocera viscosa TUFC12733]|uniref:F-box domain-containing protein n=1 Tax=Calocera viscosa (strain TUFC12733) TaxID=1330018 RepID=A0A167JH79_CALVF|nr:hypothetical protein CALVIDRAFT_245127 [Calocera viscosa TUFC12733]
MRKQMAQRKSPRSDRRLAKCHVSSLRHCHVSLPYFSVVCILSIRRSDETHVVMSRTCPRPRTCSMSRVDAADVLTDMQATAVVIYIRARYPRSYHQDIQCQIQLLNNLHHDIHSSCNMATEFLTPFSTFLTTPINSLPNEILLDIFELAVEDVWTRNTKDGHNCAFKLSQVCERWRSIMLNHTIMWRRLHIGDGLGQRQRTLECLRRIQGNRFSPQESYPWVSIDNHLTGPALEIDINCGDTNKYCAGVTLRKYLHRVTKLRISASPEPMLVMTKFCHKEPAPLLEELTIVPQVGATRWATYISGVDLEDLFRNEAPLLRKVDLTLVHLRWPKQLLKNLRFLTLRWAPFGDWPQLYNLLDALAASPELEELHLLCPPDALHPSYPDFGPAQDLFRDVADAADRGTKVFLPCFKMLALENAFIETLPLLVPFFDVPNIEELRLIADDDQSELRLGDLPSCDFFDRVIALRITGAGFESMHATARLVALIDAMPKLDKLKLQAGAGPQLLQHYIRELEDATRWAM